MSTRIREFRKLRGMTLQYLAQKVGMTAQTIQRLETGNMTVSLDWLCRIADVFGMPAAALLVTDTTASVPIVGDVNARGDVVIASPAAPVRTLSLVVATPTPIAVRVSETIGPFTVDTVLIANKLEFDPDVLIEQRACIIGLKSGRTIVRQVSCSADGVVFLGLGLPTTPADAGADDVSAIDWVAPIVMAVRYF